MSKAAEIKILDQGYYKVSLENKLLMLAYRNDMERSVRSRMQKIGKSSILLALQLILFRCKFLAINYCPLPCFRQRVAHRPGN